MVDPNEYRSRAGSVRTGARSPGVYSPAPRSKNSDALLELANSPMSYTNRNGAPLQANGHDDEEDADSNVQDGLRSELGETILPMREPGPHDPPGPKYESYDSGPSFGNFGPLPPDDHPTASNNPFAHNSWNPNGSQVQYNGGNPTTLTEGGQAAYPAANTMTPGHPARVPLPASEFAMSPRATTLRVETERGKSRAAPSEREELLSPRTTTRTINGGASRAGPERPWSPQTARSRVTTKTRDGTVYPPLPESRMGDDETDVPLSPRSKSQVRSKAASVSPSESPSQMRPPQSPSRKNPSNYNRSEIGAGRSQGPGSVMSGGHQSRPFSPYRHAATHEDLLHAAVRGRALAIPEEDERTPSIAPSHHSKAPSQQSKATTARPNGNGKVPSVASQRPPSAVGSRVSMLRQEQDGERTPMPQRPLSPNENEIDPEEARIIRDALAGRTPRTSYYAASLEPETTSHYHDMELCVLLRQENDPTVHDYVKKALRKAVRQRIKKLGMEYDKEAIDNYRKSFHDHDPSFHLGPEHGQNSQDPPAWASDIKREIVLMQQRIESLGPKIETMGLMAQNRSFGNNDSRFAYEGDDYTHTPRTQTVNIQTQPTGTIADSMYQPPQSELVIDDEHDQDDFDDGTEMQQQRGFVPHTDADTHTQNRSNYAMSEIRDDSPGQQYLEEELYKLRQKPQGSQSRLSHRTWEVARDEEDDLKGEDHDDFDENGVPASGLPTIPDSNHGGYPDEDRTPSPPLPALPNEENGGVVTTPQGPWGTVDYGTEPPNQLPPWQRIHQRLLGWAIIWPASELDHALNSTTRGKQVDEVALSIWSTQTYKRYVRARLTDSPQGVVDRLFVPPNIADAISNAVFNGRHGDACGMLRDLWSPFGLPGMPRLLVVLAKHRSDANHWVVHRFSLPDGGLTTYDSYPERTLPDGRPLGWWFAIRVAWPNAIYPSPDHLMQKMVRLHRPMQLPIDNSVAAAGIWRNILMGSRAERSLDLERLRDLINTEVKNLRQRKQLGKLSIGAPRPTWEDMN
ncbi:hypothetical protein BDZ94DRAFT_1261635 [Collybia nuda]|uniref:Uncharacterized protein n=1 Tax=Collybia nuda TaxID=64659 RepID=A0A9P6CE06_9AGAR|nr:hypothetical protein BDZ94DRAFT_1261635 [Collybia nuda]